MEAYYDASVTASILLQEIMKEMGIKETPEKCCKNGYDKKIFNKCKRVIEKEYSDPQYQDLLKLYISSYFIDEAYEEEGIVYEELDENELYHDESSIFFEDGSIYDDDINLAS
ncbi:MAG: hypothetical protein V3V16_12455 [Melioribacteraceae bacterium]